MPDRKGESSAMLSNDQPLEARASRMTTTGHNARIHYEGQAIVSQGANRIWGDVIDIDRTARVLTARGHVRTQFLDQQKSPPKPLADGAAVVEAAQPARAASVVTVDASDLVYTEADRMACYTGGVHLVRPGLDLKAESVKAWLNDSKADSALNHAFADGKVAILRTDPARTVTGGSEHAEYYAADQRLFLSGGEPTLVDSLRGVTKGRELTYFANLDKLLVNGVKQEPAKTRIIRRH
jgi:lipopolysaccharide export system protein LptA